MTRTAAPRQRTPRGDAIRASLADTQLYLVTDARRHEDATGAEFTALRQLAAAACAGGAGIVQVRDKSSAGQATHGVLEAQAELRAHAAVREAIRPHGGLVAVNDRADLALFADADVLHLGQQDLTTAQAREIVGADIAIGRSCHSQADVDAANADPEVDYFCTGPLWSTPTKPGRRAVGLDLVRYAATIATKPFFAIGGIDQERVEQVWAAGASRIVVVRAITEAADPQTAAAALLQSAPATAATPGQRPAPTPAP